MLLFPQIVVRWNDAEDFFRSRIIIRLKPPICCRKPTAATQQTEQEI